MGHPGGLLDPLGGLLGVSCSLLGSWRPLSAHLEAPWSALGGVLEVSWTLLEGSWRRLETFWKFFGSVLETFEGFLGAPESILEASGGCLLDYVKNSFFSLVSLDFLRSWALAGPYFGG